MNERELAELEMWKSVSKILKAMNETLTNIEVRLSEIEARFRNM